MSQQEPEEDEWIVSSILSFLKENSLDEDVIRQARQCDADSTGLLITLALDTIILSDQHPNLAQWILINLPADDTAVRYALSHAMHELLTRANALPAQILLPAQIVVDLRLLNLPYFGETSRTTTLQGVANASRSDLPLTQFVGMVRAIDEPTTHAEFHILFCAHCDAHNIVLGTTKAPHYCEECANEQKMRHTFVGTSQRVDMLELRKDARGSAVHRSVSCSFVPNATAAEDDDIKLGDLLRVVAVAGIGRDGRHHLFAYGYDRVRAPHRAMCTTASLIESHLGSGAENKVFATADLLVQSICGTAPNAWLARLAVVLAIASGGNGLHAAILDNTHDPSVSDALHRAASVAVRAYTHNCHDELGDRRGERRVSAGSIALARDGLLVLPHLEHLRRAEASLLGEAMHAQDNVTHASLSVKALSTARRVSGRGVTRGAGAGGGGAGAARAPADVSTTSVLAYTNQTQNKATLCKYFPLLLRVDVENVRDDAGNGGDTLVDTLLGAAMSAKAAAADTYAPLGRTVVEEVIRNAVNAPMPRMGAEAKHLLQRYFSSIRAFPNINVPLSTVSTLVRASVASARVGQRAVVVLEDAMLAIVLVEATLSARHRRSPLDCTIALSGVDTAQRTQYVSCRLTEIFNDVQALIEQYFPEP